MHASGLRSVMGKKKKKKIQEEKLNPSSPHNHQERSLGFVIFSGWGGEGEGDFAHMRPCSWLWGASGSGPAPTAQAAVVVFFFGSLFSFLLLLFVAGLFSLQ